MNPLFQAYVFYETEDKLWLWNERNFLNVIARQYPNWLKIESYDIETSFWSQISNAATKGQLQSIPHPNNSCLEPYILTVLLLKNSLTEIYIQDEDNSSHPQLSIQQPTE
ncbi:hypothetical protein BD770DRAFT_445235 [Pilaira anomala]|nr:hypothetical protein BD770DRAFT_445235 [Pilaira anomala]